MWVQVGNSVPASQHLFFSVADFNGEFIYFLLVLKHTCNSAVIGKDADSGP